MSTTPGGGAQTIEAPVENPAAVTQWVTIVWDDPVNLMSYVSYVFQEYFKYPKAKAERLMLRVHHHGKAVVSTGSREEMERDVLAMQGYNLWATMEKS